MVSMRLTLAARRVGMARLSRLREAPHFDGRRSSLTLTFSITNTKLANPLRGIPLDQLMKDVDTFVEEKGIKSHKDIFRLWAADPLVRVNSPPR